MTRPTGYSVAAYGDMITCSARMAAYDAALRSAITPGCTVLDIGAGTGIFSLLACKYGAGHVYAVEPDASIEVARHAAQDNGCADRITFVKDLSTAFTPEREADVMVSDIRGVMPLFEHHIATVVDVRARLLAAGAIQLPRTDTIRAAVVESTETANRYHEPWLDNPYGLDLSYGHRYVVGSWRKVNLKPEALLTEPEIFSVLDYRSVTEPNQRATLRWRAARPGMAHGLLLWFDAELADGIGFSNAPGEPELIYGQAFFPLQSPVKLAEGDEIEADVAAVLSDGQYIWSWNTRVFSVGTEAPVASFRQSSFQANLFSPDRLAPRAASYRPPHRDVHAIDCFILTRFDGKTDLQTVARALRAAFPQNFPTDKAALDHVSVLSARYATKPEA